MRKLLISAETPGASAVLGILRQRLGPNRGLKGRGSGLMPIGIGIPYRRRQLMMLEANDPRRSARSRKKKCVLMVVGFRRVHLFYRILCVSQLQCTVDCKNQNFGGSSGGREGAQNGPKNFFILENQLYSDN